MSCGPQGSWDGLNVKLGREAKANAGNLGVGGIDSIHESGCKIYAVLFLLPLLWC